MNFVQRSRANKDYIANKNERSFTKTVDGDLTLHFKLLLLNIFFNVTSPNWNLFFLTNYLSFKISYSIGAFQRKITLIKVLMSIWKVLKYQ